MDGKPLYQHVARLVADKWNRNGQCALVVGATFPEELAQVRAIVGDMPLLVPGIGAQGGDIEATVKAGTHGRRHRHDDQFVARDPVRASRRPARISRRPRAAWRWRRATRSTVTGQPADKAGSY